MPFDRFSPSAAPSSAPSMSRSTPICARLSCPRARPASRDVGTLFTVMLVVLLGAMLLTTASAQAGEEDEELTATEILDQVRAHYRSTEMHAETGRLIYDVEQGRESFIVERPFTVRFQRGMYLLLECDGAAGCSNTKFGLRLAPHETTLVAEGDAIRVAHDPEEVDEEDLERVRRLASRAADSHADPLTLNLIPALLMPDLLDRSILSRMINVERRDDVNLRGTLCFQIEADDPRGRPINVLIRQHDFTVARVRQYADPPKRSFGRTDSVRVTYTSQPQNPVEARNMQEVPAVEVPRLVTVREVGPGEIRIRPALRDGVFADDLSIDELRARMHEVADEQMRLRIENNGIRNLDSGQTCLHRDLAVIMDEMQRQARRIRNR